MGYGIGVIQSILRHHSPNTTERYLRSVRMEKVREALEDLKQVKRKWWSSRVCFRNRNQQTQKKKAVWGAVNSPNGRGKNCNYLILLASPRGFEPLLPT